MKQSASIATPMATLGLTLCLALSLVGCSSDGTTYGNTTGAPATGIYVIQNTTANGTTNGAILEFSTSASGAATPISTIAGPTGNSLDFLAADGSGDIYTTSQVTAAASILEYPVGSQNNAQPMRSTPINTTTQTITQISAINGLSVDATGDIYISSPPNGVAMFSSTATGSVAPSSYILANSTNSPTGVLSTLEFPYANAVDPSGNLYVANLPSPNAIAVPPITDPIVVFAPAATGNVAPTRSLGGTLTTLNVGSPAGMATDTAGNLYVANVVAGVSSILVFDPTATGNTPPLRDITGSNTQLGCLGGIAVDSEGYLYVISTPTCGGTASPTVLKFSTTGNGNIAPVATFTSAAWTNADPPLSIAVY